MKFCTPELPEIDGVKYYCIQLSESLPAITGDDNPNHSKVLQQQNAKAELILKAFGKDYPMEVYPEGKPKPIEGRHISFSHSREYIILSVANQNHGIDLQFYTDKLVTVSRKFISESEKLLMSGDLQEANRQIHFMWSAKEAVFKLYGTEVPFKEIVAHSLELKEYGEIRFTVKNQNEHRVHYRFFEDFCFCIAL